jgi:hypothetical protein
MANIKGTTRHQTLFLRAFRKHPNGPPPEMWPSPSILRKWLRKPGFVRALSSVQEALRFQTDFHLTNAAKAAAKKLSAEDAALTTQDLNRLLRHAHLRQRFPTPTTDDPQDAGNSNGGEDNHDEPQMTEQEKRDRAREDRYAPLARYVRFDNMQRPWWNGDPELFDKLATNERYSPPLERIPQFPDPVPQDTFYYKLLQDPRALLWYMHLYDKTADRDHRFQPILLSCKNLLTVHQEGFPLFASQRQNESPAAPASEGVIQHE